MGFQAVIKSAASAASLGIQNNYKKQSKNNGQITGNYIFVFFVALGALRQFERIGSVNRVILGL